MLTLRSKHKSFGGQLCFYTHNSDACAGPMNFSIFLPSKASHQACHVIYFLAGLSSSDENFMIKAGAQKYAEELDLILVAPDTSPRNRGFEREKEDWTFGEGAAFYVNATQEPWLRAYNMYDYISYEFPKLISYNFNTKNKAIMGHSMGGHGALVIGLRNPQIFSSISAFAPICSPINSAWGQYAFNLYLGDNKSLWAQYDACELLKNTKNIKSILIDQGLEDQFLETQLGLDYLKNIIQQKNLPIDIRVHAGYDHSYYFIATFIESHLRFHVRFL